MADRFITDISVQHHPLGSPDFIPARHGVPCRTIRRKCFKRGLAHHVEVHRAVGHPPSLAQLIEFDALDLVLLHPLPDNGMTAEVTCIGKQLVVFIPSGNDPDIPG